MNYLINEFKNRFNFDSDLFDIDMISLYIEDEKNRENNIKPDTTGADKCFVEGFFTEEMHCEFWTIAKDFLTQYFSRIKEFSESAVSYNNPIGSLSPEIALKIKIFHVMYHAAKSGDAYSAELMKSLYKTYHKAEYNQLKRFRKISASEIISLAEAGEEEIDYDTMARILGMCQFLGIELEERCSILYLILERHMTDLEVVDTVDYFSFKEGLYLECFKQVEKWMENEKRTVYEEKRNQVYWDTDNFAGICFERKGFVPDFMWRCYYEPGGPKHLYTLTLALMKSLHPNKQYTFEQVQTLSVLTHCIDAFVSVCSKFDNSISVLLGTTSEDSFNDIDTCLYKPITIKEEPIVNSTPKTTFNNSVAAPDTKETDYLTEINELRSRLREKDQAYKQIHHELEQARASLKEAQELMDKYESDREELIALRNHVYNISQSIPDAPEEKLDEMKQAIAEKNIVIIGGHINWVNKLKKEFPKWKLLDANIPRDSDGQLINGAEKVYFFSEHLSHRMYGRTINLVRSKKIPFGYLNSINMESIIRQIYEDFLG